MAIENIGEITTYLEANKENTEVKTYLDGFKVAPTLEAFKGKLNDPDFKSFMDSERDKHSTKSLDTWKTNNLQGLIDAKVKELHPDADPRDTAMNALKAELAQMKAEGQHKELTIKTSKLMQEKKLPMDLLELLIGADETITNANVQAIETVFKAHVEELVAERLKGGYQPPTGSKTPTTTTKEAFAKMGYSERARMAQDNPELYNEMVKK